MRRRRSRRLRTRVHPVAWLGSVAGCIFTVLLWLGVARSSGSGWVQALGALLAAVLLVGLVAPAFVAARLQVHVAANPSDTVAGAATPVELSCSGPARIRPLRPSGAETRAPGPPRGTRPAVLEVVSPAPRASLDAVEVEVASSLPFGIVWWARERRVALVRPLHVAPRTGRPERSALADDDTTGSGTRRVPASLGEPRGVREYRSGDLRRAVHWPATAHSGALMVRETEGPATDPVVLRLDLPDDPAAAEQAAEAMMATASEYLAAGVPTVLVTLEASGPCRSQVRDRIDLGRRLARARSGRQEP